MAKYTTEVRSICETYNGLIEPAGYSSVEDILTTAAPKVFDFDFPIFDEDYRLPLERKILRHYYTREISEETVGLWKLRLDARMNEIMPYYNKLYNSELLEFNPFYDVDLTTTHTRDITGDTTENTTSATSAGTKSEGEWENSGTVDTSTTNVRDEDVVSTNTTDTDTSNNGTTTVSGNKQTTGTGDAWSKYSATPQGGIDGLEEDKYLTNATHNTNETKGTENTNNTTNTSNTGTIDTINTGNVATDASDKGTLDTDTTNKGTSASQITSNSDTTGTAVGNSKTLEEYTEKIVGKRGSTSYAKLLEELRKTFLNIDVMIINDLKDLFFNLW